MERRQAENARKRDRLIDQYATLPTLELMEREDVIRSILEARWMLCETVERKPIKYGVR
jgi:hypothetical protein